jgi:hypothetical protein
VLHVVGLDAAHGVQWPPLLQAIVEHADPLEVRITGAGTDRDLLRRPGTTFTLGLAGAKTVNEEVGAGGDGGGIPPP